MLRFALTTFLSAFLLFAVQPLLGRYILPWFGGTPGVWTTCLLMFQVLLLGGYAYAHGIVSKLPLRYQGMVHFGLLAVALAWLPITPSESWKPADPEAPTLRIMLLIGASVGFPYLLLASTAPLIQSWFSRVEPGRSPFRLYALSNIGSMAALLSYPLLVEPRWSLHTQTVGWSIGFALFALSSAWCAVSVWRLNPRPLEATFGNGPPGDQKAAAAARESPPASETRGANEPRPDMETILFWLALSGVGSLLLMATTNELCQEVAVVPFLWVLPLALYLLTFIICFDRPQWYHRGAFGLLWVWSVVGGILALKEGATLDFYLQLLAYSGVLFGGCMICHGELIRAKPAPRDLTLFYLMISAGGALGGVFVAVIAPIIFPAYFELHVGFVAGSLMFCWAVARDPRSPLYDLQPWWAWAPLVSSLTVLLATLALMIIETGNDVLERSRNFYGVLRVKEQTTYIEETPLIRRSMVHGNILHGVQLVPFHENDFPGEDPERWATSYYGPTSGVGLAVTRHPLRAREPYPGLHIGVVGLGTGTLASLGQRGDRIRFYEINPEVVRLSDKYFSYRRKCPGVSEVVLGDARLVMERALANREPAQFDVLAIDAFSSDAIPIHLLTRESFAIYWQHLKRDGLLVVHVSNNHLDLQPIVRGLAAEFGKVSIRIQGYEDGERELSSSNWIIVTDNAEFMEDEQLLAAMIPWTARDRPPLVWTDDYAALVQVLKQRPPAFDDPPSEEPPEPATPEPANPN